MGILKRGLLAGLKTTWTLSKVIFPITLIVIILQYTPVLPWIIDLISPFMGLLGLRGEASIPLVLGNALNLYAGIAGILSLELTVKEVFILATMLSFSHNIFIETAVALRVGVKLWVVLVVRFGLAILSAILINVFWKGGGEIAKYGVTSVSEQVPDGWGEIILLGLQKATFGVLQLALIVIPLMVIIQFLKERNYLQKFSNVIAPFTKIIGVQPNASLTLVAGLVMGLAYGAGVMIQAVREDGVSKKDTTLAFIFRTLFGNLQGGWKFLRTLGIPILPLFLIRISTAFILTIVVAYAWRRAESSKQKEVASL